MSKFVAQNPNLIRNRHLPCSWPFACSRLLRSLSRNRLDAEGAAALAPALAANGALTALDLSFNALKDEGVNAVCKAIQNNKETKLAKLNFQYTGIGPVGTNAVAAMVAVTGALTKIE